MTLRESSIDATREWLEELDHASPITGRLGSAFPVREEWLQGKMRGRDIKRPDWQRQFSQFGTIWRQLLRERMIKEISAREARVRIGALPSEQIDGGITAHDQQFWLELRSQIAGENTLLRCRSEAEFVDTRDDQVVDQLFEQ